MTSCLFGERWRSCLCCRLMCFGILCTMFIRGIKWTRMGKGEGELVIVGE